LLFIETLWDFKEAKLLSCASCYVSVMQRLASCYMVVESGLTDSGGLQ